MFPHAPQTDDGLLLLLTQSGPQRRLRPEGAPPKQAVSTQPKGICGY